MLNVINKTPFEVSLSLQRDLLGHDCVCVFFSASLYLSNDRWFVSRKQMLSPLTDQYWDSEATSPIRYPSQLSHSKPGTDVIVNAHAVSPHQRAVEALDVHLDVAGLKASAIVFGDRVWQNSRVSCLGGFLQMPITWDSAFGGVSVDADSLMDSVVHEYNPLGMGYIHPSHGVKNGAKLPKIELPECLIRAPYDSPEPAGFGALGPESPFRARHAGTYDEQWQKQRSPYLPHDFNSAFFQSAVPALRCDGFLQGQEEVQLTHLNQIKDVAFDLPGVKPEGSILVGNQCRALEFRLDTIVLETLSLEVKLFWTATTLASRSVADISDATVWLAR